MTNAPLRESMATCQCGCGKPVPLAKKTSTRDRVVKGRPVRFLRGHGSKKSLAEQFWTKVNMGGDGCWNWTASTMPSGYGCLRVEGKTKSSHRTVWQLERGEIPHGLCVLHVCDNRRCVRPDHLFLGTRVDNIRDMEAKGRANRSGLKGRRAA
jgi:hypothetical protein